MQHKLAELKTEICVGRAFVDNCLQLHAERRLDPATASMAKYWWECLFVFTSLSDLTNRPGCWYSRMFPVFPPGRLTSRTGWPPSACSSTEAGATCGNIPSPSKWGINRGGGNFTEEFRESVAGHVSLSSPGRLWTLAFSPSTEAPTRSWRSWSPAPSSARSETLGCFHGGGALGKVGWFAQMIVSRE